MAEVPPLFEMTPVHATAPRHRAIVVSVGANASGRNFLAFMYLLFPCRTGTTATYLREPGSPRRLGFLGTSERELKVASMKVPGSSPEKPAENRRGLSRFGGAGGERRDRAGRQAGQDRERRPAV